MSRLSARTFHPHLPRVPAPLTWGLRAWFTDGGRKNPRLPVDAVGVDLQQDRDAVPGPAGGLGRRHPGGRAGYRIPLHEGMAIAKADRSPDGRSRKVTTATSAKSHEMHRWTGRIPYQSHTVTPTLTNPCGQRVIMMPIAFAFLACYCKLSDMPKRGGHK
jgi:hypothetical protein